MKSRCFPLEYYPGEILTEKRCYCVEKNRIKKFYHVGTVIFFIITIFLPIFSDIPSTRKQTVSL